MVAVGAKRIETRSWYTNYRGRIAIHAAKEFPAEASKLCFEKPFSDVLQSMGLTILDLPLGCVIATAELWRILQITDDVSALLPPPEPERSFGDYTPGRYAWYLRDVRAISPVPCKGAQGLWEWKEEG